MLGAQERGANALAEAVFGLGVNARVLLVGAHPDDEDTFLIAWLSRGRHVETAYLSLTRGDGGQNLIGNELGEALGVIRTEELAAARRVDGAKQFFTRAYDFGFSKDTCDTFRHWPRDSLLGDVVKIVRAFRPHVIVGVFSGTPRDGHGQHQVSGILAREAYELAGDTVRFPEPVFGSRWTPLKFYRAARFSAASATLSFDAGEYSPVLGRSFAEIAGESRSQHKSQGFGALQRKGPLLDYLRREASRVNEETAAPAEQSLFDGIDTSWARLRPAFSDPRERGALDSLPAALAAVNAAFTPLTPRALLPPLARVQRLLGIMCANFLGGPCAHLDLVDRRTQRSWSMAMNPDVEASVAVLRQRLAHALQLASGVEVEAFAPREVQVTGRPMRVEVATHNRGADTIRVARSHDRAEDVQNIPTESLAPGRTRTDTIEVPIDTVSQPWWLRAARRGALFRVPASTTSETELGRTPSVTMSVLLAGQEPFEIDAPLVFRYADEVRGEVRRRAAGTPAITATLDQDVQYAPAHRRFERLIGVHVRSADDASRDADVALRLPSGLTADSASRRVRLAGADAEETVTFRVRGELPPGQHRIEARVESGGEQFASGYQLIDYEHIRPQRLYRAAAITLSAVDVRIPAGLRVAYVAGVSDNVAPMLAQLGLAVTEIPAREVGRTDLRRFTTLVIGPRAYDAHPELVAENRRIQEFVRSGGTVVLQYGQYELMRPGVMPYPITIHRPHDRVTHEDAPVAMLDSNARALRAPNRITAADFDGWIQERALYMPRSFDERYRPLLEMNDPGEPPNRGAILVAPVGRGTYVYTTLAFFRQLPAGSPGAARLFVNLLSAGVAADRTAR